MASKPSTTQSQGSSRNVLLQLGLAVLLRIAVYQFGGEYLAKAPELVVPTTSYKRLKEGVFLKELGEDPYNGDLFHLQPMVLTLLSWVSTSDRLYLAFLILCDIASAFLLRECARIYTNQPYLMDLVFSCFLLNPMAIAICGALSLSCLTNLILSTTILTFLKNKLEWSGLLFAILMSFNLYYSILIGPLLLQFGKRKWRLLGMIGGASVIIFGVNYKLSGDDSKFIESTYLFQLKVTELYPDVGLYWYMFCEVFIHFEVFFKFLLQLHTFIYIIPLAIILKDSPLMGLHVSLIIIACYSSYPSYGDAIVHLALLPLHPRNFLEFKKKLLVFGGLVACFVLFPTMWTIWMIYNAGNANFYFSLNLVYVLAHNFLITDLIQSHQKLQIIDSIPELKKVQHFILQ